MQQYQKLGFENKNEILNKDGLNEARAKLTVMIKSIEFVNTERHTGVYVSVKFLEETKNTSKQNNGFEWDQMFEL